MTAIRPDTSVFAPLAGQARIPGADDAARQAQAAFFRTALAGAAPAPAAAALQKTTETEAPRPGRPGALLDIRV